MGRQLPLDFFPAEERPRRQLRRQQAFPAGDGQQDRVPVRPRPLRAGGLFEEPFRRGARLPGIGHRLRREHHIPELAVVGDILRGRREEVDDGARALRALGQRLLRPLDPVEQPRPHGVAADSPHRFVVHLPQVRAVSQPPRPGNLVRSGGEPGVLVVEEPRQLPPPPQPLLQLDPVHAAAPDEPQQVRSPGLPPGGLRVEEDGEHRLFDFAPFAKRRNLLLGLPRLLQLGGEEGGPVGGAVARFLRGDVRQFPHGLGETGDAGSGEERGRADQRRVVPFLRLPHGGGEHAQDAARALEPGELRPPPVEDIGEVGVEGEVVEQTGFGGLTGLPGIGVEPGEVPRHRDGLRTVVFESAEVLAPEEPAAQDLRHILLADRLHAFVPRPPEDAGDGADHSFGGFALRLRGIARQQRHHQRRGVHPVDCLREVLEEVGEPRFPDPIEFGLLAGVHQDFVHQHQRRRESAFARGFQEFRQQRFGGRRFAFFRLAVGVDRPEPVVAGELVGEDAPRVLQRPLRAVGGARAFDPLLGVDLVEAERGGERARRGFAEVLAELPDRLQVGQSAGGAEEVVQRDQRVRLPAAVGQLQLPDRLVALAGEPERDILREFPQRVREVGQREEFRRVLVEAALSRSGHHIVEVGREFRQREFPGAQFLLEMHQFAPRRRPVLLRHVSSPAGYHSRRVSRSAAVSAGRRGCIRVSVTRGLPRRTAR